jgi:hypothetical protein
MSELARWSDNLKELTRIPATGQSVTGGVENAASPPVQPQRLESSPVTHRDLLHRARQIRRVPQSAWGILRQLQEGEMHSD